MTRTLLASVLLAVMASATFAGGMTVYMPRLDYPEPKPVVTQGCNDITTVTACAPSK